MLADRGDGGPHLEGAGELVVAVEGAVADGLERGGLGEVDPRETGLFKGVGADRGDGGPQLEGAGELGAAGKGAVADGLERGGLRKVEPRERARLSANYSPGNSK